MILDIGMYVVLSVKFAMEMGAVQCSVWLQIWLQMAHWQDPSADVAEKAKVL